MNTVVTINLNGRAYQIEEPGYVLLKQYIDRAGNQLEGNPDKNEIMADLEQAIADKANRFVGSHKNVLFVADVETIINEMGPVDVSAHEPEGKDESAGKDQTGEKKAPKRFYLIREGAYLAGVCTGLSAYFNIDVTWVRLIFIALTLITHGLWVLVYIVMAFVVPYAQTSEQKAEAHGEPFSAHEIVERAKERYKDLEKNVLKDHTKEFKRWGKWAREKGENIQSQWSKHGPHVVRTGLGAAGVIAAIFIAVLAMAWLVAIVSLVATGALFGFVFVGIPLWVAILIITFVYHLATLPLRSLREENVRRDHPGHYNKYVPHNYGAQGGWSEMWDALMWFVFFALIGWAVWTFIPSTHGLWERFADWVREIVQ